MKNPWKKDPKLDPGNIRKAMRRLVGECRDALTNEVNHTLLAEKTAQVLDCYVEDENFIPERAFTIPDLIFEIAIEYN